MRRLHEVDAPYDVPFKSIQLDFEEFLQQAVAYPQLDLTASSHTTPLGTRLSASLPLYRLLHCVVLYLLAYPFGLMPRLCEQQKHSTSASLNTVSALRKATTHVWPIVIDS